MGRVQAWSCQFPTHTLLLNISPVEYTYIPIIMGGEWLEADALKPLSLGPWPYIPKYALNFIFIITKMFLGVLFLGRWGGWYLVRSKVITDAQPFAKRNKLSHTIHTQTQKQKDTHWKRRVLRMSFGFYGLLLLAVAWLCCLFVCLLSLVG